MTFALAILLSFTAFGQDLAPPITDINSVQALRNIESLAVKNPTKLSDSELGDWVRARFAWVALLRLEGKTAAALKVFEGCDRYCGKFGPSAEWASVRTWGCEKLSSAKKKPTPCK